MRPGRESLGEASLVPVPLLRRQEAFYRWLIGFALLALAPIVLLHLIEPQPDEAVAGFLVGFVGSFAIVATAMRRSPKLLGASFALGALACAVIRVTLASNINVWLGGLGIGAMLVLAIVFLLAGPEDRAIARPVLVAGVLVPLCLYAAVGWTKQTERLLPSVFDTFVFAADSTLGVDSFRVGRLLEAMPWFEPIAQLIYDYQWPFLMLVWTRQLRDPAPRSDFIATLVVVSFVGVTLFYVFPVVGPWSAFAGDFPSHPPPIDALRLVPIVALPERRNCLPSLHNAWAILALWNARPYGWQLRLTTWALVLVTILATLGFGYHYVLDIVVALPVALFAAATTSRGGAAVKRLRLRALILGSSLTLGWLIVLRYGVALLTHVPGLTWLFLVSTVLSCLWVEHRLATIGDVMVPPSRAASKIKGPFDGQRRGLHVLAAAVAWLAVTSLVELARRVSLELGYTVVVLTSFLVALLVGVGLGALWGDSFAPAPARRSRGAAQLLVAFAFCSAIARWELLRLRELFARLAHGCDPGGPAVRALTIAIVGLMVFPIAASLGGLFAVVVRSIDMRGARSSDAGGSVLVAIGLGAALASLTTAFVAMPQFAEDLSLIVAGGVLLIAFGVMLDSSRTTPGGSGSAGAGDAGVAIEPAPEAPMAASEPASPVVLALGGLVTSLTVLLAQQTLAASVGESFYTRTTTLGVLALSGSAGALVGRWSVASGPGARVTQAGALLVLTLGAGVMGGGRAMVAGYFASFGDYPVPQSFAEREFIRAAIATVLVAPAVGAAAALLTTGEVGWLAGRLRRATASEPGRVVAWTVVGAVVGVLVYASGALPAVGARDAACTLAAFASALGALKLVRADRNRAVGVAFAGAAVLASAVYLTREPHGSVSSASGSEVYFRDPGFREVATVGESWADGRIVIASASTPLPFLVESGSPLAQGSAGGLSTREYAALPLAHTEGRERAAVLGLGSGESSARLVAGGFRRVDVFEPVADVVRAASHALADLNDHVAEKASVRIHAADGRTGLLIAANPYDVIFVGGVAPFSPRAAAYGDVELYRLAASRLAPHGVLVVAFRTDHLEWEEIMSTALTARQALPSVFLYARGDDAAIVACAGPCPATFSHGVDASEAVALDEALALSDVDVSRVLSNLEARGIDLLGLVSTDDNARRELSAARATLLPSRPPGSALAAFRARAAATLAGAP